VSILKGLHVDPALNLVSTNVSNMEVRVNMWCECNGCVVSVSAFHEPAKGYVAACCCCLSSDGTDFVSTCSLLLQASR
jgi:hypothetical protein